MTLRRWKADLNLLWVKIAEAITTASDELRFRWRYGLIETYFDTAYYLSQVDDISIIDEPQDHYCKVGWKIGLDPSPIFSTSKYLEIYPQLKDGDVDPLTHYILEGRFNNKQPTNPTLVQACPVDVDKAIADAFDLPFYNSQLGRDLDLAEALSHYKSVGWRLRIDPAQWFSVSEYIDFHEDVGRAEMDPFEHYFSTGKLEARATTSSHAAMNVSESQSLDRVEILDDPNLRTINSVWQSLLPFEALKGRPLNYFDPAVYRAAEFDAQAGYLERLLDYKSHGCKSNIPACHFDRIANDFPALLDRLDQIVTDARLKAVITQYGREGYKLAFEVILLGEPYDRNVSYFSSLLYLYSYKDIEEAGVLPFLHFIKSGIDEGRRTTQSLMKSSHIGHIDFDLGKETIVIGTHELTATGAPAVSLDIARCASRDYNVVIFSLKGGRRLDDFREYCVNLFVLEDPDIDAHILNIFDTFSPKYAIINSVESWPFIRPLVRHSVPIITYIHEFYEYTRPDYKSIFVSLFSEKIVFGSKALEKNWFGVLTDCKVGGQRVVTLPQYKVICGMPSLAKYRRSVKFLSNLFGQDFTDKKLIYGAGQIQLRKGVDIFISAAQVAAQIDPGLFFIWIGDGLDPSDLNFGTWLNYQVRQSGLSNLAIVPAGPAYPHLSVASDAMFLSSRLDPLPNVAFDALKDGAELVVFDGATGFDDAEFREMDNVHHARYLDTYNVLTILSGIEPKREKLGKRVRRGKLHSMSGQLIDIADRNYDELRERGAVISDVDLISYSRSLLFNQRTFDQHVAAEAENQLRQRLSPDYIWRSPDHLRHFITSNEPSEFSEDSLRERRLLSDCNPEFFVHIHAYYVDEISDILFFYRSFRQAKLIVITTDSLAKQTIIEAAVVSASLDNVIVEIVDNRGRDILPFLFVVKKFSKGNAERWLHIHLKKSVDTLEDGTRWRDYNFALLLGSDKEMSSALVDSAATDVGLVFPFDPYSVGWGRSRPFRDQFNAKFKVGLPESLVTFPIGNMFIARADIVISMLDLFGKNYQWPGEPVPDDGSCYHFIERIWPSVCHNLKYRSLIIYDPQIHR